MGGSNFKPVWERHLSDYLSLEFEEPHPLGVFDNFPKGDPPHLGSWTEENIELQRSLEVPICNCDPYHTEFVS